MTTPTLHLQTLFQLDPSGRIVATLEPDPSPGPLFVLVRGTHECAWAVHTTVPDDVAAQLERLAQDEPPAGEKRISLIDEIERRADEDGDDQCAHADSSSGL